MSSIQKYIATHKMEFSAIIMKQISQYIYRNTRYKLEFSLVALYCENKLSKEVATLKKKLRESDRLIYLNENLYCIVLDGISAESCEKAAENLNYHLLETHANNKYYLSAEDSQKYNQEYANMIQILFERLEYAIENNLENIVICQDYVV